MSFVGLGESFPLSIEPIAREAEPSSPSPSLAPPAATHVPYDDLARRIAALEFRATLPAREAAQETVARLIADGGGEATLSVVTYDAFRTAIEAIFAYLVAMEDHFSARIDDWFAGERTTMRSSLDDALAAMRRDLADARALASGVTNLFALSGLAERVAKGGETTRAKDDGGSNG